MSSEIKYFNRSSVGQTHFYAVLFQDDDVASGSGFTSIAGGLNNTTLRSNLIQLLDTPHPGLYFGQMAEGTPAGNFTPVVFQASGDPATTATTTDPVVERLPVIAWNGESLGAASNEDTRIISEETEIE